MPPLDLDTFGPWREDLCDTCQVVKLVTGPGDGEQRCRPCWYGEPPARPTRVKGQAETLFDLEPYQRRGEGA